jgi:hypothetical protein
MDHFRANHSPERDLKNAFRMGRQPVRQGFHAD